MKVLQLKLWLKLYAKRSVLIGRVIVGLANPEEYSLTRDDQKETDPKKKKVVVENSRNSGIN